MLRITTSSQAPDRAILQLEGVFAAEDVELVEREGLRLLQEVSRLVLDMHGVRFIDQRGIDLLKSWPQDRLVLRGASTFIRALLDQHGLLSSPTDLLHSSSEERAQ